MYGPQFDAATISPRGDLVALTATAGTKGLLLGPGGDLVREVDRSYYCAHIYRYPLALGTLPDGRTGIVHCPRDYNRLDICTTTRPELAAPPGLIFDLGSVQPAPHHDRQW